jgi:hypothetical protein
VGVYLVDYPSQLRKAADMHPASSSSVENLLALAGTAVKLNGFQTQPNKPPQQQE